MNAQTRLFKQMLEQIEFGLIKTMRGYQLQDLTDANLNNIEDDVLTFPSDIIERLDNYIFDYFVIDLRDEWENYGETGSIDISLFFEDIILFIETYGSQEFIKNHCFEIEVLKLIFETEIDEVIDLEAYFEDNEKEDD